MTYVEKQEIIPISISTIRHLDQCGTDMELLATIFISTKHSTRYKKQYLYSLTTLTENQKDTIWVAFIEGEPIPNCRVAYPKRMCLS